MINNIKIWMGFKPLFKKDDIVQCINRYHDSDRYLVLDAHKWYYILEQYIWSKALSDWEKVPGSAAPVNRSEIEKRYVKVDVKKPTYEEIFNKLLDDL